MTDCLDNREMAKTGKSSPGPAAEKLKALRARAGVSMKAIADAHGVGLTSYQYYEDDYKKPFLPLDLCKTVANVLGEHGVPAEEVLKLAGISPNSSINQRASQTAHSETNTVEIIEIDGRSGLGLGGEAETENVPVGENGTMTRDVERSRWGLPDIYVSGVLGVHPDRVRIREVQGDSMSPTLLSGDRVMINLDDTNPAQGGIFELWDGFGMAVKRLDVIRDPDPILRIICDNPLHQAYQATFDEVNIIGRVVWYARRM